MRRFDFDGHPWAEEGQQGFRLVDANPEAITPQDQLRLTDRATGDVSFWRAEKAVRTDKGWRGALYLAEPDAGSSHGARGTPSV